jgi:hypothetical protein
MSINDKNLQPGIISHTDTSKQATQKQLDAVIQASKLGAIKPRLTFASVMKNLVTKDPSKNQVKALKTEHAKSTDNEEEYAAKILEKVADGKLSAKDLASFKVPTINAVTNILSKLLQGTVGHTFNKEQLRNIKQEFSGGLASAIRVSSNLIRNMNNEKQYALAKLSLVNDQLLANDQLKKFGKLPLYGMLKIYIDPDFRKSSLKTAREMIELKFNTLPPGKRLDVIDDVRIRATRLSQSENENDRAIGMRLIDLVDHLEDSFIKNYAKQEITEDTLRGNFLKLDQRFQLDFLSYLYADKDSVEAAKNKLVTRQYTSNELAKNHFATANIIRVMYELQNKGDKAARVYEITKALEAISFPKKETRT